MTTKKWGGWTCDSRILTLRDDAAFQVDLARFDSSAKLLAFIFHWRPRLNQQDMADFLLAVEELLNPLEYYCASGFERNPNPLEILDKQKSK